MSACQPCVSPAHPVVALPTDSSMIFIATGADAAPYFKEHAFWNKLPRVEAMQCASATSECSLWQLLCIGQPWEQRRMQRGLQSAQCHRVGSMGGSSCSCLGVIAAAKG